MAGFSMHKLQRSVFILSIVHHNVVTCGIPGVFREPSYSSRFSWLMSTHCNNSTHELNQKIALIRQLPGYCNTQWQRCLASKTGVTQYVELFVYPKCIQMHRNVSNQRVRLSIKRLSRNRGNTRKNKHGRYRNATDIVSDEPYLKPSNKRNEIDKKGLSRKEFVGTQLHRDYKEITSESNPVHPPYRRSMKKLSGNTNRQKAADFLGAEVPELPLNDNFPPATPKDFVPWIEDPVTPIVKTAVVAAKRMNASDLVVFRVRYSNPGDAPFVIIMHGSSHFQIKRIRDEIEKDVVVYHGLVETSGEQRYDSGWVILDFEYVLISLMTPFTRLKYALESRNDSAERIDLDDLIRGTPTPQAVLVGEVDVNRKEVWNVDKSYYSGRPVGNDASLDSYGIWD